MEYTNYITDFPCRINKLYEKYLDSVRLDGLEVTFLLSLTASGIEVPFDRLRPDSRYPDPSEDRNTFKEAAEKFDQLYAKRFQESELWSLAFEEWRYGKCTPGNTNPDSLEAISPESTVEEVIKHLRVSLAHGIILTHGDKRKEIKEIRLFNGKKTDGLRVLSVTPHSLGIFLSKWIEWLQTLDISIWGEN